MVKHFFYKYLITKDAVFTIILILFSILVAIYPFFTQYIFGFDQTRDAYEAYAIWHNHDIKIQGASSDIPGIYHGVLWYYVLAFFYALTNNAVFPVTVIFFVGAFSTIPLVGYVAHQFFRNKQITYTAMALYAFSPMFQAFTRWLSNPILALYITPVVLLGIYYSLNKPSFLTYLVTGMGFGLLVQSDFAFISCFITLPCYFLLIKQKKDMRILVLLLGLFVSLSSFIAVEVKFHGKTITSLLPFLFSHMSSSTVSEKISAAVSKLNSLLAHTVFPFPFPVIIVLLIFLSIYYFRRKEIQRIDIQPLQVLLIWLLSIGVYLFFDVGITKTLFAYTSTFLAIIFLTSYAISLLFKKSLLVIGVVGIICMFQISISYHWIQEKYNPYTAQQQIFYSDAIKVIDYTYMSSHQKPFAITTVTNPLYINTTWAFLYTFYGKSTYGYTPFWDGRDQTGYLGSLPPSTTPVVQRYILIEPRNVISDVYIKEAEQENKNAAVFEVKRFGEYVVENRLYTGSN